MTPASEDFSLPDESRTPPWEQLDRYLMGEATGAERDVVERWVKTSREGSQIVAHLRATVRGRAGGVRSGDPTSAEVRVRIEQILSAGASNAPRSSAQRNVESASVERWSFRNLQAVNLRQAHTWRMWANVMLVAVVMVFGVTLLRNGSHSSRGVTRTYTTTTDQQASVTLPDGTHALLGSQSRLRLVQFGATSRAVDIEGEVYFDVQHASGLPFVVHGGDVTARVLGTAFFVRHVTGESSVHVAVANGRVYVSPGLRPSKGIILGSGSVGDVKDSTVQVTPVESLTAGTEWVGGRLVFHDAPVSTILATLSRWYGYQFRYADSDAMRKRVTIGISVQSSTAALSVLKDILEVNLTVRGDTVTLTPQTAQTQKYGPRVRNYDVWSPTREVGR